MQQSHAAVPFHSTKVQDGREGSTSNLLVAAVLQEVWINDENGVHMLCAPTGLNQCRVVMHTQALQQKATQEITLVRVCRLRTHVVALPGPC
jgi:hypothetical protein